MVTTNYDNLLERAFEERGRPFHVVIQTTDSREGEVLHHRAPGSQRPEQVSP